MKMMEYVGIVVEALFCVFVFYSVNKVIRVKDSIGIARIADAFVWCGVLAALVAATHAVAALGIVSSGMKVDALGMVTIWAISYIIAWVMPVSYVAKKEK